MSVYPSSLDVVAEVGGLVESLGRETGREVGWSGGGQVWADPTRLRQIIRNLVINAFRYGGPAVRVVVLPAGDPAVIEVRDSGGPIPSGRVATMFDSFDHTDDGEKNPSSVGLGLAVARSLARLMGGDLVYDYDGESIFRLTLRVGPGHAEPLKSTNG
jgi:two-component system sensor histidine kinase BaeS